MNELHSEPIINSMEAIFSEKDDLLKKENKLNNDYDEIVRVFYDGRGLILMDRFGV